MEGEAGAGEVENVVLDVLIDLDDCLYSRSTGIAETVRQNIIGAWRAGLRQRSPCLARQ